jgi:hypothetical protein
MRNEQKYSFAEAEQIGNALGIDWKQFSLTQFRKGLVAEVPQINIDEEDAMITGKIVLAHLNDFSGYYTRLARIEKEADQYWADV